MSRRRTSCIPAILALLASGAFLAACDKSPSSAWNGPGWYLELPYPTIGGGPSVYGGPYSYDKCEEDRKSRAVPDRYICVNETQQPRKFGFY
ncbi:MAG: hypothetical protein KIT25_07815 [Enhydrobacter sp.]|nr:MAG: hypothetical protein KIT25_07815 [Enhydrobacter sp.]